jgi:cytoplasmic tRNA 2-thiolation protein 2
LTWLKTPVQPHLDLPLLTASPLSSGDDSPLASLKQYLAALPTQTAFVTAVQTLTRMLLLHTAASRQASHLLLGTSLTSLSVNLISSIAQGSGFAIVEEIQEEWLPRTPAGMPIRVVRPLRDIGMKDCAIWNWWHGLRPLNRPPRRSGDEINAIDTLTRGTMLFSLSNLKH